MTSHRRIPCMLAVLWICVLSHAVEEPTFSRNGWTAVSTPFRAVNLTALGSTIWVCGADEMILSSKDGTTWETKHQNRDGEILTNISFIDGKVGHAGGTGGLMLSTIDGGETWKNHRAPDSIRSFSFSDAANGIAVVQGSAQPPKAGLSSGATPVKGAVKITRDGGESWEDIPALSSDELLPYTEVLSVAALDSSHYLMLRGHPEVEDAFVISKDGGKSWKVIHMQNDASNRVLAKQVFVHQGEYWAFGMELVHREKGGGYGVPLAMHSKDGEKWTHGIRGANEFQSCNWQGCYLWDGAVEAVFGEHEQFWALPQDGSLSQKWAIAGNVACTVSSALKCSAVTSTNEPQPRKEGITTITVSSGSFADGCLECPVEPIVPDRPAPPAISRIRASISLHRDGSVAAVSLNYPGKRMNALIVDQLSNWLFEPAHDGAKTTEARKDFPIIVMCSGFPGRPETDRCTLHAANEFSRQTQ